jgi:hypothetical protein
MCRRSQSRGLRPLLSRSRSRSHQRPALSRNRRSRRSLIRSLTITTIRMTTMPMMMTIPGTKPMIKTKTDMTMPVLEKINEPTMTDDEIVLWLITKGTMEDKPIMRLAADRLIQMAQALREHDDD